MIPCHSLRNKSKVVGFKDKEEEDTHRISFREIAVFTEGSSGDPLDQSARRLPVFYMKGYCQELMGRINVIHSG